MQDQPLECEMKDGQPPANRFSAVIEKIERLYMVLTAFSFIISLKLIIVINDKIGGEPWCNGKIALL